METRHTLFQNGYNMNIGTIVVDLANSRLQLDTLKTNPGIAPTKLDYCTSIVDRLENTISELLTLPWIPRTVPGLNGAISAILHNIHKTEAAIDDRLDEVWQRQVPDEVLRTDLALIALDTLRFQLSVLIEARLRMVRNTLKEIEVEFVN
jgi:hypothetical protein